MCSKKKKKKPHESPLLPFARGGLAGMTGWVLIHPADVIKVRLQNYGPGTPGMLYTGPTDAFRKVASAEGFPGLYSGLSAALTRQLVYGTLRLGFYQTMRDRYKDDNRSISIWEKLCMGLISGGTASFLANPIEVSMVRIYSDGAIKDVTKRRNYSSIGNALYRIGSEEGVRGLYTGSTPTIFRAMLVSSIQLGVYDQAKESYIRHLGFNDGTPLHFAASLTSGYAYSAVTLPIDLAKSRMQNEKVPLNGTRQYTGIFQCISTIARTEGFAGLWKGFTPYFARCGGHTIFMFLALEQIKKLI